MPIVDSIKNRIQRAGKKFGFNGAATAVVSEVPTTAAAVNRAIAAQAKLAGLPLSPVAAALDLPATRATPGASASPTASASPSASSTPDASAEPTAGSAPAAGATATATTTPAASASPGVGATPKAAATAGPSAGSTPTAAASSAATNADVALTPALVAAWARLDAATFVRAVQPAFFAPVLASTGLGVTYYDRTQTNVVVVGSVSAAARLAARLDVFGYVARRGAARLAATPLLPVVYYRAGDRWLAFALAGDLGLPTAQVRPAATPPAALTVVLPT